MRRPSRGCSRSACAPSATSPPPTPNAWSGKLGRLGLHFYTLAQAQDPRRVDGHRKSKSIGSENTLERDVRDKDEIKLHLRRSADKIARRLRAKGLVAYGVGVKLKTAGFKSLTRQQRLAEPTDVAEQLYRVGVELLDAFNHPGPFRLVGMVAYDLAPAGGVAQAGLFDTFGRRRQLEVALDALAERFGGNAVRRADDLGKPRGMTLAPNLDFMDDGADDERFPD